MENNNGAKIVLWILMAMVVLLWGHLKNIAEESTYVVDPNEISVTDSNGARAIPIDINKTKSAPIMITVPQ